MRNVSINTLDHNQRKKLKEFESLAFPLVDRLYYTALRMAKHSLNAEDLIQDTCLKAWRFYHQFKPGTNFRAWINRILITTFINRYRSKKREPFWVNVEAISATLPDEDTSEIDKTREPGFAVEHYDELFDDTITAALNRLPEYYRTVVLLSDVSDLKYKEIAEVVGCPVGTVMSRLSRGRRILAQSLKQYAVANGYISQCLSRKL